jgi:hypothetical protein
MDVPDWAFQIVKVECALNKREIPEIKWRKKRANGFATGGRYTRYNEKKAIRRVSIGRDNHEKQVLLHELSHHLDKNGGHGSSCYLILRDLLINTIA